MAFTFKIYTGSKGSNGEAMVLEILNFFVQNFSSMKEFLEIYEMENPHADGFDKYGALGEFVFEDEGIKGRNGNPLEAVIVRNFYKLAMKEHSLMSKERTKDALVYQGVRLFHPEDVEDENSCFHYNKDEVEKLSREFR